MSEKSLKKRRSRPFQEKESMAAAPVRISPTSDDHEITRARRVERRTEEHGVAIDRLDEPFDELGLAEDVHLFADYLAYLNARHVPARFFPHFEAEARALSARFPWVSREAVDTSTLEAYFEEGRLAGLTERALRNRRVGSDAFVEYLRERSRAIAPPTAVSQDPSERRRHPRVSFLTEVFIDDVGKFRCCDISAGGMYIEGLTSFRSGTLLRARFKLRSADAEPISVVFRITFVHPHTGSGLEFVSLSPGAAERIAELIAAATSRGR
jgi:hypothetical protein